MSEKRRVLIVDDERLIRRAMADYLEDCGYETAVATDGADGLERARAEQFDIVLVDLRMNMQRRCVSMVITYIL